MKNQGCRLKVRFWGVRGSVPTPRKDCLGFGGNTPCVEVRTASDILIFDAGTGIRDLGTSLVRENRGLTPHLFLSHLHWDHIQGLPFFSPLYQPDHEVNFYSRHPADQLDQVLRRQMAEPHFPVAFELLKGRRKITQLNEGSVQGADWSVQPFPVNHPHGAVGYRIESAGAAIVYATDLEQGDPELDRVLEEASEGVDLLICDAQYTPEEYEEHRGWGHSTWRAAVQLAETCRVGQLLLFHHDPDHDDRQMADIESQARQHFSATEAAREGMVVRL